MSESAMTMQPIDPALKAEIDSLAAAIEPILTRRPRLDPRDLPEDIQQRRTALLERHLGRELSVSPPLLHCVGDSNSMFFSGAERLRFIRYGSVGFWRRRYINRSLDLLPCFRVYHTGPSTAWKAAEFKSSTRNREKIEWLLRKKIPKGAKVLLSFGEIDCRIHMPRQALAGANIAELAEKTADHFLPLVRRVREGGFDCAVWNVSQISPRDENDPRSALPAVGPLELRHEVTYAYVDAMAERCAAEGIPHVSLAGTFNPRDEPMPEAAFLDGVHLSQVMMPRALEALAKAGVLELR